MVDIDTAMAAHQNRLAESTLDRFPDVWAGHYAGDRLLGEIVSSVGDLPKTLWWVGSPFAYAIEVTDTFLVWHAPRPLADPAYLAVHLNTEGHSRAYRIGYSIIGAGVTVCDPPEVTSIWDPVVTLAVHTLFDLKASASHNFDEAVAAAVEASQ